MAPEEGRKAPSFSLPSSEGRKISLNDFSAKGSSARWVVLYFYPKDDTPGCTTEAGDFRDRRDKFRRQGCEILGVSPDPVEKHDKFITKHGLNFTLLADVDRKVCKRYGVWVEKTLYGRKYMGVERSTFLIAPDGKIARVWLKVKVKGHAEAVLEVLKEAKAQTSQL